VTFEVQLPRDLDSAAAARHAVDQLSGRLPEDLLGDVRLLVSELVTNSLRHAELGPEDSIVLVVGVDDATVRVEVADSGKGFEYAAPPVDPQDVDGWGLYLVQTLSDRWGVDRAGDHGRTKVWFELDRGTP
jgi:anti-sigma regulatory factor (Ser/Thr protein kinase)